ncbi:hypothetical protein [Mycobacteroides abscessus]|uniref:hypothetical protein n=1 Tax=Mycobacteroides abscessus TaxID=36809 RepID=UPI0013F5C4B1|nr:hypothetical protein [Mycobacteroides abscessus]MBN7517066.1 hypothetical protein [Mycobacteroides abscessus subsp. abscessus]MDB2192131.1 hypothetical protein [Mycobacteroides abscessus subsp. abscessus]
MTITVRPHQADILAGNGFRVGQGMVVVIDPRTRQVLETMDSWDFAEKYSKDGL